MTTLQEWRKVAERNGFKVFVRDDWPRYVFLRDGEQWTFGSVCGATAFTAGLQAARSKQNAWAAKRKRAGDCVACGKPRNCDNAMYCVPCRDKVRERSRAYYYRRSTRDLRQAKG